MCFVWPLTLLFFFFFVNLDLLTFLMPYQFFFLHHLRSLPFVLNNFWCFISYMLRRFFDSSNSFALILSFGFLSFCVIYVGDFFHLLIQIMHLTFQILQPGIQLLVHDHRTVVTGSVCKIYGALVPCLTVQALLYTGSIIFAVFVETLKAAVFHVLTE